MGFLLFLNKDSSALARAGWQLVTKGSPPQERGREVLPVTYAFTGRLADTYKPVRNPC
jgi:hypothetical protein